MPVSKKDYFNSQPPVNDSQFAPAVANPELAMLLPVLYPGAFPNLAACQAAGKTRPDIVAIFLTGIPASILPKAPTNVGGTVQAEMLRLNVAVAPTTVGSPNYSSLGVIGGDIGGFPNGRRLQDHVALVVYARREAAVAIDTSRLEPPLIAQQKLWYFVMPTSPHAKRPYPHSVAGRFFLSGGLCQTRLRDKEKSWGQSLYLSGWPVPPWE